MPGFNRATMLGNVTCDPKLTYDGDQTAVVDFALAVNRKWTAADGRKHEETCFIDVCGYGKLAENVSKYVMKGSLVLVDGRLCFETWEKDGQKRSKHRLMANHVQFMPDGRYNRGPGQEG